MQTVYNINQLASQAGMIYDLGENDFISAVNQSVAVGFGLGLAQGSGADGRCKLPAASGDVTNLFLGISALVQTKEQPYPSLSGPVQYPAGSDIAIMRKGRIWVQVEEAVVPMGPVFCRFASGAGGTQLGAFRTSADTATAAQVPHAVYRSTAAAQGFAVVELNNP